MHNENEMTLCYMSDLKKAEEKIGAKCNELEKAISDITKTVSEISTRISSISEEGHRFNSIILRGFGLTQDELERGFLGEGIGPRITNVESAFNDLKDRIKELKIDELWPKIDELVTENGINTNEIEKLNSRVDLRIKIFYEKIRSLDAELHALKKSLGK